MEPIKWTINRRGCYYNSTTIFVIGGAIVAKLFSEEEIQELVKNENVISIDTRQIIHSNEFKQFFVEEYMSGKGPTMIFESAGLYKSMLGAKRIEKATKRWVTAYNNGTLGVSATLKTNQIKVHKKGISDKEKIKRQDTKIKLLELEVDLLNKHNFINYDAAMIHSDQGWHYSNPRFRVRVGKMGMLQSMSRRGNCWDNAPQESFFGHLKDEVEIAPCEKFDELVASIDDYIDYYNNDRYQSGLEKMTPVKYRHHLLAA